MKKSLNFWSILPALLIISGVLLLIFQVLIKRRKATGGTPDTVEPDPEPDQDDLADEPDKEQRIINNYKIIRKNLPESVSDDVAKMITAQAMHETGIFTSRLYQEQNNMFGMKHPEIRETLSIERRNGFATFGSLDDSVKDMLLYYAEFKLKPNWKEVHTFVKEIKNKGYFEAPFLSYFNATRSHYNTVKSLIQ